MKKLILALCVCAGLCACSSDDDLVSSSLTSENLGQATAYLKVKIKDVNSQTRASDGGFAYGSTDEQTVNNAYFYFYDNSGNYLAKGNVASPEGTAATDSNPLDETGNIEWESETVVAVWGLSSNNLPTQMLTVLNKPTGIDFTGMSLDKALATLAGTPWGDTTNGFVMSTSAYYNSAIINTTALEESDFAKEPVNLGTDYPYGGVDVYVERLAAKVGLDVDSDILWNNNNQFGKQNIEVTGTMFEDWAKAPAVIDGSTYVINLQGWDVDCIARDAYVAKNIDFASSWANSAGFTGWNEAGNYRCYWAESPAYGDSDVKYPTSSNGNTAKEEDDSSTWLNKYLRYVDLQDPVALGSTTYCGENTNTVAVLGDKTSTALTNVLLKAQFGYEDNNYGTFTGVDFVKYHGEYLTLEDFEADMISEVMAYDIRTLSQEVVDYLIKKYGENQLYGNIVKDLASAIENDAVYMKETVGTGDYEVFDSRFLQLINKGDGKVGIWFNTTTSTATDGLTHYPTSETKGHSIPDFYNSPALTNPTKGEGSVSMDDYTFAFKLDTKKLSEGELTLLGTLGLNDDGYLPLGDSETLTIETEGGNTYTFHQYFIRAIEREAAGINDDWEDAGYPYFYNEGLMYYNVPIEHLASAASDGSITEAEYGVVRNHWYNITVTSITDFGHAIADESEVIVPQVEEDYYYAGVNINILSWNHITQGVDW